ncbi:MAG TPA: hypothetical protein VGW58_12645 [Pyrinomonadaceae bacterium]|nr:hypothetical protein [Pyrinomonadaceae bacterium]
MRILRSAIAFTFVAVLVNGPALAQRRSVTACKRTAAAALKPMPQLNYQCGEGQDWDEKQLKNPARLAALKDLISELSTLNHPEWWQTTVSDLNACDFKDGQPGPLNAEERRQFADGEYAFWLFGEDQIRLLMLPDPCYQTEYGGSNGFLLYRDQGKVYVSQVLDGYFSRADNPVILNFGKLNSDLIIEIATWSGGLNPTLTNYYFAIDATTKHALPKKLFAGGHGPTNEISSAVLFGNPPPNAAPLNIIRDGAFAKSFSVYTDSENGKINDNGRTLSRTRRRWNGKLYR